MILQETSYNEEEADKPVPKRGVQLFHSQNEKTQVDLILNRKNETRQDVFSTDPASVFGKCVRDCDRAGERAESAVCNGGMPDGWRYRPCAVRKTRDRSYGNGEHNENHDMHSGTGKRTNRMVATASAKATAAPSISRCAGGEHFCLAIFYIP